MGYHGLVFNGAWTNDDLGAQRVVPVVHRPVQSSAELGGGLDRSLDAGPVDLVVSTARFRGGCVRACCVLALKADGFGSVTKRCLPLPAYHHPG